MAGFYNSFDQLVRSLPKNVRYALSDEKKYLIDRVEETMAGKPKEEIEAVKRAVSLGVSSKSTVSGFREIDDELSKMGAKAVYSFDYSTNTIVTHIIPDASTLEKYNGTRKNKAAVLEPLPTIRQEIEVSGNISRYGQKGINKFEAESIGDDVGIITTQRRMIDETLATIRSKKFKEEFAKANQPEGAKDVTKSIKRAQRRASESMATAGSFVPLTQEGRNDRSGSGSPYQQAINKSIVSADRFYAQMIKKYRTDLSKTKVGSGSYQRHFSDVEAGFQLISQILSVYPATEAIKIISQNPKLKVITDSAAWKTGNLKRELTTMAKWGIHPGLAGENSFAHREHSLVSAEMMTPMGFLEDKSSRKLRQTRANIANKKINYNDPNLKKFTSRSRLFSKAELGFGVRPQDVAEMLYGVADIDLSNPKIAKILHDKGIYAGVGLDGLLMLDEAAKTTDSNIRRSKTVNKGEYQNKLAALKKKNKKLTGDSLIKAALQEVIGSKNKVAQYANFDDISSFFDLDGNMIEDIDKIAVEYLQDSLTKSGTKMLLGHSRGRHAQYSIPREVFEAILAEAGYNSEQIKGISAIRQGGAVKSKNIGPRVYEAMQQVFSMINDENGNIDQNKKAAIDALLSDKKNPLKKYISWNEKLGVYETDATKFKLADGEKGVKQFNQILEFINSLFNAVADEKDIVEKGKGLFQRDTNGDKTGWRLTRNFVARTSINQMQEIPYGEPGGAVVKADYRMRGAANRVVGLGTATTRKRMDNLSNYLSAQYDTTIEQKKHYEEMQKSVEQAEKETLNTLADSFDKSSVLNKTIGYGKQYAINLAETEKADKELIDSMNEYGQYDARAFENSTYGQIYKYQKEHPGEQLYFDTGADFHIYKDEKTGKEFGGKLAALSSFDIVPVLDENGDVVAYSVNQEKVKAFGSMKGATKDVLEDALDISKQNRRDDAFLAYYTAARKDIESKEGITYEKDMKTAIGHSMYTKSVAGNYSQIPILWDLIKSGTATNQEKQDFKILSASEQHSYEDVFKLLSKQEIDGKLETDEDMERMLGAYAYQLYGKSKSVEDLLSEYVDKKQEVFDIALEDKLKQIDNDYDQRGNTILAQYDDPNRRDSLSMNTYEDGYVEFDNAEEKLNYRIDLNDRRREAAKQAAIEEYNKKFAENVDFSDLLKSDKDIRNRVLRRILMDTITIGSDRYNNLLSSGGSVNGLITNLFRNPLSNGLDDKFVPMFINKDLDKGSSIVGLGAGQSLNLDNDGDKIATILALANMDALKSGDPKKIIDEMTAVTKMQEEVSGIVAVARAREENGDKKDFGFMSDDEYQKLMTDRASQILAKYGKNKTGSFSNEYQAVTEAMNFLGIDEQGVGKTEESQMKAAMAMITRGFFESFTQKAISSKKVADRIMKKHGDKDGSIFSNDDSVFYREMDDLLSDLSKAETFNSLDALENLKARAQKAGIIGEGDEAAFDTRINAQILGYISKYSHGKEILENIFNNGKKYSKDEYSALLGQINEGNVAMTSDQVMKALQFTNTSLAERGGIGGVVASRSWTLPGASNVENNPVATMGEFLGANNEAIKGLREKQKVLKDLENAQDSEADSEKRKIVIAQKEASVISDLNTAYGRLSSTLSSMERVNTEKVMGDILNQTKINPKEVGLTGQLHKQFGSEYFDRGFGQTISNFLSSGELVLPNGEKYRIATKGTTAAERRSEIVNQKIGDRQWIDINGNIVTNKDKIDQLNRFGYDQKSFDKVTRTFGALNYGNVAHTVAEMMQELGIPYNTLEDVKTPEDFVSMIRNKIAGIHGKGSRKKKANLMAKLTEQPGKDGYGGGIEYFIDEYKKELKLIGKSDEEINELIADKINIGRRYADVVTEGGARRAEDVLFEERLGVLHGGVKTNSAIDSLVYDPNTGSLMVNDYKTKSGKVGAVDIAQVLSYGKTLQEIVSKMYEAKASGNEYTSAEDFTKNIGEAFGFTADKPMSDRLFDVLQRFLQKVIEDTKEKLENNGVEVGDPNYSESLSNMVKNEIFSRIGGSVVRGTATGGDRTFLSPELFQRVIQDGVVGKIVSDIISGNPIGKDAQSVLANMTYKGQGLHDTWGGGVTSSYESEAEAEERKADALKMYSDYLKKRVALEAQVEQYSLRAGTTMGKERQANEDVVALLQRKIALLDQENAGAAQLAEDADKEKKAEIDTTYELEKQIRLTQKLASNKGNVTLRDVVKRDIQNVGMRIANFGLASRLISKLPQSLQKIKQETVQLEEALMNLRVVTGYNRKEGEALLVTYNKLSKQLGATTVEVANAADTWLRQGYDVDQAESLITASMKLSKLGKIDSAQATKSLTSALKAYKMEASEAIKIVDKLTKVDMKAAVSSGDIAEGLSRVANTAQLAGLSIDETIGMISTIGEVTQRDLGSVGDALRTMLSRYGNVKAGVFAQMGLSDDGETTENINDIEKVLKKLGISIRSSSMQMRDISDVLDELSQKWYTLDSVTKNAENVTALVS